MSQVEKLIIQHPDRETLQRNSLFTEQAGGITKRTPVFARVGWLEKSS